MTHHYNLDNLDTIIIIIIIILSDIINCMIDLLRVRIRIAMSHSDES